MVKGEQIFTIFTYSERQIQRLVGGERSIKEVWPQEEEPQNNSQVCSEMENLRKLKY